MVESKTAADTEAEAPSRFHLCSLDVTLRAELCPQMASITARCRKGLREETPGIGLGIGFDAALPAYAPSGFCASTPALP